MARIELTDTTLDVLLKMADGNPGAIRVLGELMKEGPVIDPDSWGGGLASVLDLDTLEIYGPQIWVLYKDVCGSDIRRLILLQRAAQLGFFRHDRIKAMAADDSRRARLSDEEWAEIDSKVCERLPRFAKPVTESQATP